MELNTPVHNQTKLNARLTMHACNTTQTPKLCTELVIIIIIKSFEHKHGFHICDI